MQNRIHKKYVSFTLATTATVALVFGVMSACTGQQAKAKPNFVTKDAPRAGVVAKIGSEEITEEMLIGSQKLDFLELKKREYEMKMNQLNKLLVEKLIGEEAKKANMSLDDYVNKKVVGGEIKISDSDFKKLVKEKNIPESQINPTFKERIVQYMQAMKRQELVQAHVAKLTKSNPVEVYFSKPKLKINVERGDGPTFGGKDAKVQIVEFSDFQCPFCNRAKDRVTELKKKYGNKISITFRHFPLPMHREAAPASEASMCVNEQGTDKFWKFHDLVFENQKDLDPAKLQENLENFAKKAGADVEKFKQCFTSKKYANRVQEDMKYGEQLGVQSTPTFFINGELVSGAVDLDVFTEIIDEQL